MKLDKELLDQCRESLHKLGEKQDNVTHLRPLWTLLSRVTEMAAKADNQDDLDAAVKKGFEPLMGSGEGKEGG